MINRYGNDVSSSDVSIMNPLCTLFQMYRMSALAVVLLVAVCHLALCCDQETTVAGIKFCLIEEETGLDVPEQCMENNALPYQDLDAVAIGLLIASQFL